MRTLAFGTAMIAILTATAADAQSPRRVYAGAQVSSQRTSAAAVKGGGVMTAGGLVGVRLTPAFSIEFAADGGLGEVSRTYSGWFVSFAQPGASYEDIVRLAPTLRKDTTWTPGFGWSVTAVARTRGTGRVGAAVFGGITSTRYDERSTFTVLDIPAGVRATEADLHRMVPDEHRSLTRAGLTAGLMVPITVARRVTVAPEFRYTYGSFGDVTYTTLRGGARVMWGF